MVQNVPWPQPPQYAVITVTVTPFLTFFSSNWKQYKWYNSDNSINLPQSFSNWCTGKKTKKVLLDHLLCARFCSECIVLMSGKSKGLCPDGVYNLEEAYHDQWINESMRIVAGKKAKGVSSKDRSAWDVGTVCNSKSIFGIILSKWSSRSRWHLGSVIVHMN